MSTVYTDTVTTLSPTQDLTIGTTGQTVTLPGNDLRVNTVKDKGGNTLWTSDGSGNLSSVNAGLSGNITLLTTNTFTNAASSVFTTLIDSTYDVYIFKYIDINPATDQYLQVNFSSDGGSNYNMVKTTTFFEAYHYENGSGTGVGYNTGYDLAQSTAAQPLAQHTGAGADNCLAGALYVFAPSSTVKMKHFYATSSNLTSSAIFQNPYVAGYVNSTSAVNAVQFTVSSGNFDGIIKMYGLS